MPGHLLPVNGGRGPSATSVIASSRPTVHTATCKARPWAAAAQGLADSHPANCRKASILRLDQRELRAKLEVDHGLDAAVELKEGRGHFAGHNFVEDWHVLGAKAGHFFVYG